MNSTENRNSIPQYAKQGWRYALERAESIEEAWFRCQALVGVARYVPEREQRLMVLQRAFAVGAMCDCPNRVVSVSSWPIKALYSYGFSQEADEAVRVLLNVIAQEASPVRRADALDLLLGAVLEADRSIFWMVYESFFDACTRQLESGKRNAKGQGLLSSWAGLVWKFDAARGNELVAALAGPTHKAYALQDIEIAKGKSLETFMAEISRPPFL